MFTHDCAKIRGQYFNVNCGWPHTDWMRDSQRVPPSKGRSVKQSAGILMFRRRSDDVEVFLVHPGGPYWAKKDFGSWSIPKGECGENEPPLAAAQREFKEETGSECDGDFLSLGEVKQGGGKRVVAWAVEGDLDPATLVSNTCSVEWPPRSGKLVEIPEVDRGDWFSLEDARRRILKPQRYFLEALLARL